MVARFRFIPRAQQLDAEIGVNADIVGIERERLAVQGDRFLEPILRRRALGGDAIGIAEARVDLQRFRDVVLKISLAVFDVRKRRIERQRIEAGGIDRFGLGGLGLGRLAIALVELQTGQQQMRLHRVRISGEHFLRHFARRRRIHVGERLRHAELCGQEIFVERQRGLK